MTRNWLPRLILTILLALAAWGPVAHAQEPSPPVSAAEIENLLGTLEDDVARQKFIEQLRTLVDSARRTAPEQPAIPDRVAARFLGTLSDQVAEFGRTIVSAAAFIADAPKLYGWFVYQWTNPATREWLLELGAKVGAVLFAGWIAEWIVTWLLRRPHAFIETRRITSRWMRVPFLGLLALLHLIPILVFAAIAFATLTAVEPTRTANLVALALINANLIARVINLVAWTILCPRTPALRPVPLADETAAYLYVWLRRIANLIVYGYFLVEAAALIGLPQVGYLFLMKLLGIIVALLFIVLILQNRAAVSAVIARQRHDAIAGGNALRRFLGDYWHIGAVLYVISVLVIWILRPDGGFEFVVRATGLSIVFVLLAILAAFAVRRLMTRAFKLSDDIRQRFPTLEARANRYVAILNIVATVAVWGFAALSILQAWGLGSLDWLTSPFGRRVTSSIISIGITLLVALIMWEGANAVLERNLTRALGGGKVDALRRSARVRTLMPIMQRILFAVLAIFVVLVALSEIGINIAPLLAGAGVVGIAVGFGAQTLVKNFLTGMSIILEDSMAVGDVVDLGGKSGVVEQMSIGYVQLRTFEGTLHTIPFSEVLTVSNMTKDFSFAVFDINVSYDADIDRVTSVIRATAAELRKDSDLSPLIRDDIEVVGVDRFADSAIIIKARIRTLPGKQWQVGRAFNRLLKMTFDREGIEIPFPQRMVRVVAQGGAAADPMAAAAAGAAAGAAAKAGG
jgi:moderate conductance mechanosensitive channel